MRIESHEAEEIKLEMTSMIDIVFQLLVFFIMTFKVVAMEGDFNIRMPKVSVNANILDEELPELITVKMIAGENGVINSIVVTSSLDANDKKILDGKDMFAQLTSLVETQISPTGGNPESAGNTEVEFDIDFDLKYKYTVRGIEAVSGRLLPDGEVKKLIEKIKFKDNSGNS